MKPNWTLLFSLCLVGLLLITPTAALARSLVVLERGAAPLRLLSVEQGGKVVRFVRGARAFRFDVKTGTLTVGADRPKGGSAQLPARTNLWVDAAGDGTLRWRSARGSFRLALYPASDGERWVLFTPSGYYDRDATARTQHGDWLVGWELPGDERGVDHYPLGHFASYYHRPDVARTALSYEDEGAALHEANLSLPEPPRVPELHKLLPPRLVLHRPGLDAVVTGRWLPVEVSLHSPSGEPIAPLEARVSDMRTQVEELPAGAIKKADAMRRDITLEGTARPDWQRRWYRVRVPAGSDRLTLWARTRYTQSAPLTVRLKWQGQDQGPPPKLEGLVIGVSTYQQAGLQMLPQAAKDARDLKAVLLGQAGRRYRAVEVTQVLDKDATKQRILAELDRLAAASRDPEDVVVIFFAGHGDGQPEEGRFYFVPHDGDTTRPQQTQLESQEIKQRVERMVGRVLLFLDACHSGGVFSLERGSGALARTSQSGSSLLKSSLADLLGVVIFAAARGNEAALERRSLQNGVFTKALIEGLQGGADLKASGVITVSQLEVYVGDRVRKLTQGAQNPATAKLGTLPDYPVAQVPVPLWRKRAFWPVVGGTLAVALVGAAITMGVVIKPDFNRGNTGWLAAP